MIRLLCYSFAIGFLISPSLLLQCSSELVDGHRSKNVIQAIIVVLHLKMDDRILIFSKRLVGSYLTPAAGRNTVCSQGRTTVSSKFSPYQGTGLTYFHIYSASAWP